MVTDRIGLTDKLQLFIPLPEMLTQHLFSREKVQFRSISQYIARSGKGCLVKADPPVGT